MAQPATAIISPAPFASVAARSAIRSPNAASPASPDPAPDPAPAPASGPATSAARTDSGIRRAIAAAADRTGIDFDFLLAEARVESALDPDAGAPTSSARGLYQFIESTWLSTMKRHGPRFGFGDLAARIETGPGGEPQVRDPAQRRAILALRSDPATAALMAASLAEDNRAILAPALGRDPGPGELYLAHFLGAGAALRFLGEMARDPAQGAAGLFPRAAAANGPVFRDADGRERSLAQVMEHLAARLGRAGAEGANARGYAAREFGPVNIAASSAPPSAARPFIQPRPVLALPANAAPLSVAPGASARPVAASMSSILEGALPASTDTDGIARRASEHVRAAYEKLKAVGL